MNAQSRRAATWEYVTLTIARSASKAEYHQKLVEAAEIGTWEVRRVLVFPDGTRRVTLRRRQVRVVATVN